AVLCRRRVWFVSLRRGSGCLTCSLGEACPPKPLAACLLLLLGREYLRQHLDEFTAGRQREDGAVVVVKLRGDVELTPGRRRRRCWHLCHVGSGRWCQRFTAIEQIALGQRRRSRC